MEVQESLTAAQTSPALRNGALASTHSRNIVLARIAWAAIALVEVGLFVASIPARWQELDRPSPQLLAALRGLGMSPGSFTAYNVGLETLFAITFLVVALVILWRRSDDLMAIFVSLMLITVGPSASPIIPTTNALSDLHPEFMPLVRFMTCLSWVLVFIFFCVFPDGRFAPRWSRYFAVFATLITIPWNLLPDWPVSPWTWPMPIFVPFEIIMWGTCVYVQVWRYRHASNNLQKQQTKWIVFGLFVAVVGTLAFFLPRMANQALARPQTPDTVTIFLLSSTMICLSALAVPISIAISILRYKLWDIDLIISRTLVYVPLTAILAGMYTASITLFQRLFLAITGDKSDTAVVMSALILASMFTPVKNALQTVVDKRFKHTTDPHEKLTAFTHQVESVVQVLNYRRIAQRLVEEATSAFGARGGAVYLGDKGHTRLLYSCEGWDGETKISVSLTGRGTRVGTLVLGARENGVEYTKKDRETLRQVVDLVADALALEAEAA